jgi:hypothetical protein
LLTSTPEVVSGIEAYVRRLAAVVLVGAVVFGGLAAALFGLYVATAPGVDCPPLGNGGAMHVHAAADEVPNESVAKDVVRSHLAGAERTAPRVRARPKPPATARTTTTTTTTISTITTNASSRTNATPTARATRSLRVFSTHFHGKEQIHPTIGGGDVEHYHVDVVGASPVRGYVVTEDGELYRVVQGDC